MLLQNITNFFMSYNDTLFKIFRNSGKDYNDLGRYEDCENMTDFRYILATVATVFPIPISLGLCVPIVCTVKDFNSFKPFLVTSINDIIYEEFAGIKGFDTNTQLNAADLEFKESLVENEAVTRFGTGALIVVLLSTLMIIGIIFSSVMLWLNRKKEEQLEEQRVALV
jgi:hypothetical protein